MKVYLAKRLFLALLTLFLISTISFVVVHLLPGGPIEQMLANMRGGGLGSSGGGHHAQITQEQREMLIRYYGFDQPMTSRFFTWMGNLLRFDFGESYFYTRPVKELLKESIPVSFVLGFFTFMLAHVLGVPLGVWKALRSGSVFDKCSSTLLFVFYSLPSFVFGVLLIVLFGGGTYWNIFPIDGIVSDGFYSLTFFAMAKDLCMHLFLPVTCLTLGSFATLTIVMKHSTKDQLKSDYLLLAKSKGLTNHEAVFRHCLRNAVLPVVSGLGYWISSFFAGSLITETLFNLRGVGRLSFEAITQRDYPIVLAVILVISTAHVLGNLISDFTYILLDPRLDFET